MAPCSWCKGFTWGECISGTEVADASGVCRNSAFTLTATYSDDSPVPEGFDRCIGVFEVGPPPKLPPDGSNAKIKVCGVFCTLASRWPANAFSRSSKPCKVVPAS